MSSGIHCLVIDLEACNGMDSTFMGTMAGIAMRLAKLPNGTLQVHGANEKNRNSLEDLGLSMLLEINPDKPVWCDDVSTLRTSLKECAINDAVDKTQHVFDAHSLLCEADESNDEKFSTVLDVLEAELKSRSQQDSRRP